MIIKRFVILLCAFVLLVSTNAFASNNSDSISGWDKFVNTLNDLSFLIVPVPGYSPETDWSFGLAGAYYFTCKGQDKLSDIGFDGAYTLNHQWNVNIVSTVYFGGNNKWFLYSRGGYKQYPDYYYGINSRFDYQRIGYSSNNFYLQLQPQRYLTDEWIVGGNIDFYYDYAKSADTSVVVPGWNERIFLPGFGGLVSYDSRDGIYYPSKGFFVKLMGAYYPSAFDMSRQMGKISVDYRHYITLYKELIFAYQFKSEWAVGKNVPFQMFSTIGGMDVVRGIRQGQFRDNAYMALQAELRFPIWNIFRGCVFWGMGDVYNTADWRWQAPKMGYGLGLRLAINKQKVNVRFDIAHDYIQGKYASGSGYDYWRDGWSFYLTLKEAF